MADNFLRQAERTLGPGFDPGYEGPVRGTIQRPPEPDDYLRQELGDTLFQQYVGMTPQERFNFVNDPQNGFVPPPPGQAFRDVSRPSGSDDSVILRDFGKRETAQREALNGLQTIMDQLQETPQVLDDTHTLIGRMETGALAFRDRLGVDALDISPEQASRVGDQAAYRQRLLTNVNAYIKEITGAQVGQGQETRRLMAVQPNENDSPEQLVAKLQGAMDMARLNIARYRYMQASGVETAPTDQELRDILIQRGRAYAQEAERQGLQGTDARIWAAEQLSREFGF